MSVGGLASPTRLWREHEIVLGHKFNYDPNQASLLAYLLKTYWEELMEELEWKGTDRTLLVLSTGI